MNTQTNNQTTDAKKPITCANAYGVEHMHELNGQLQPLTNCQAEQTINFYKIESAEDGKKYAMVFKPGAKVKKTVLQTMSDVAEGIISYLRKITGMPLKKINKNITLFFTPKGKLLQVAVTCKTIAKKLLYEGFQMLQFPIAITTS